MKNEKIIEVLDSVHLAKVDIEFLSNLLNAWNVDKTPITHNDLHGLSRICDKIDNELIQVENLLKSNIKQE